MHSKDHHNVRGSSNLYFLIRPLEVGFLFMKNCIKELLHIPFV